ncbi:MAG: bifunctional adenosylcobinamide kinase/adenosylcobinamide-phosphate guanylyltransferase [Alphaproteobacteria bacterium]|nr:bifunctional adenosylcobinamide kinase/adenosylcobinamide-phosphate guanylyltransferase [Alphaproteobacteria bacterium]
MLTLVLGGARSGKSAFAESLLPSGSVYLATAQALDAEMVERVRLHRARRVGWETVEEPLDLAAALTRLDERAVLVDCLTLWLSNLMLAERDVDAEIEALCRALPTLAGPVAMVANEVGWGIVPDNALARAFRDHAGRLNQRIAALADRVVLVVAGLPLTLKDTRP